VLQHPRAGDAALLGDVADQEHGRAGFLGVAHQPRGALAHLADGTGRGGQRFGPQGLHRVGHDQARPGDRSVLQDVLNAGLGQRLQVVQRQVQAHGAAGDLRQRLLAGHVQCRETDRHLRQRLQQQGGLADARIAADQHHGALDQPAAQYPVELADPGGHPRLLAVAHVLERRDLGRIGLARPPGTPGGSRGAGGGLQYDLAERIPRPALGALALPFAVVRPALGTDEGGTGLGGRLGHGKPGGRTGGYCIGPASPAARLAQNKAPPKRGFM